MNIKNALMVGVIGLSTGLGSCSSDEREKEKCIESAKIEQVNTLVSKPDSLQTTIQNMTEDDVIALLKCSNLFDPGDENRVHAVVLQEIGKNFTADQVKKRPDEVKKYLAYMNIFTLNEMGLDNDDMPQNSSYEKARFGNIEPKALEYDNEAFYRIKNSMLVIASGGESAQFEANLGYNRKEIKAKRSTKNGVKKFGNGQTIYVMSPEDIAKIPNNKYGIIQIKGHTGDMHILNQLAPFIQENTTIVLLGGCNSELYIEQVLQLGGLPITNKGLGEGTHNDYISVQLLKQAKTNPKIPGLIKAVKDGSTVSSGKFNFPDSELTEKINGAMQP